MCEPWRSSTHSSLHMVFLFRSTSEQPGDESTPNTFLSHPGQYGSPCLSIMDPNIVREGAQGFRDFMECESTKDNGYRDFEDKPLKPRERSERSMGDASDVDRKQVPIAAGDDSRHDKPRNWSEVKALQVALEPSMWTFARVTGRAPPETGLWDSYARQFTALQQMSYQIWRIGRRAGQSPRLARLQAWTGGIRNINTATVEVSDKESEGSEHPKVLRAIQNHDQQVTGFRQPRDWHLAAEIKDADIRVWDRSSLTANIPSEFLLAGEDATTKASEAWRDRLEAIVARDLDKCESYSDPLLSFLTRLLSRKPKLENISHPTYSLLLVQLSKRVILTSRRSRRRMASECRILVL